MRLVYAITKEVFNDNKLLFFKYILAIIFYHPLEVFVFSILFSRLFANIYKKDFNMIKISIIYILILFIINRISKVYKDYYESLIIPALVNKIRVRFFENILKKNAKNFSNQNMGDIMTKIVKVPHSYRMIVSVILSRLSTFLVKLAVICGLIFYLDKKLGIFISAVTILSVTLLLYLENNKCLSRYVQKNTTYLKHNSITQDKLQNLFNIYLSNTENSEIKEAINREDIFEVFNHKSMFCSNKTQFMVTIIQYFGFCVSLYYLYLHGTIKKDPKKVVSILILLKLFLVTLDRVAYNVPEIFYDYSMIKTADDILDNLEKQNTKMKKVPLDGDIVFKNVNFKYPKTNKSVLKNLNLNIKNNDTTVIYGKSGSGKSTIVKIIFGFYNINSGSITINSHDLYSINLSYLRSYISYMGQNNKLFNESILNNIKYGNNLSNKEVIEFIKNNKFSNLDNIKLSKVVGPDGSKMSGGQKQSILLYRVLLSNKKIIILDEPTSALDDVNFNQFIKILNKFNNKTYIVITHDKRLMDIKKFNFYKIKPN